MFSNRARRVGRSVTLQVVLLLGAAAFAAPFVWLFGTSCKTADEMYPPRWIPEVPAGRAASPYIELRENERPECPVGVRKADWIESKSAIEEAIAARVSTFQDELPPFYGPYLQETALVEGLFGKFLRRAPETVFDETPGRVAGWFAERITAKDVAEVFERVYRRLSLSQVAFHGWDGSVEYPEISEEYPWKVLEGPAELVTRREGLLRPAEEVHYDFSKGEAFCVQTVLPLDMNPENMKKVVLAWHSDRTWHRVWACLEIAGEKWNAAQPAFTGSDRWQETTWQRRGKNDDVVMMRPWLTLAAAGESDFTEPGYARLTLTCLRASGWGAAWNKYTNNYREVLRLVPFGRYVRNSAILVVLNVLGQIVGSSLVAFSFSRLRWPGRDACFLVVLATLMIPAQVTMIPVFLIFKSLGWYNTLRPLWVVSFCGSAFYIFLLRQFMRGIPRDLEDSARIDGCGYFGIYARIIVPLVKPALAAIGIFTFMGTWNDFMGPLIYLNDQRLYPLSLGLFALQVFKGANFGLMMAAAVVMTLPVVVVFFAAQRHFIQGITLTGLKG